MTNTMMTITIFICLCSYTNNSEQGCWIKGVYGDDFTGFEKEFRKGTTIQLFRHSRNIHIIIHGAKESFLKVFLWQRYNDILALAIVHRDCLQKLRNGHLSKHIQC